MKNSTTVPYRPATSVRHYAVCLSIAGSDPSGGAGIQADLKTFAALGCYGAAAITAVTVQNTLGVSRSEALPPELVAAQIDAVTDDLCPAAIKIGITATAGVAHSIACALRRYPAPFIVLDPVMVSSSGRQLMDEEAVSVVRDKLMPLCTLLTPNLPELVTLTGTSDAIEGGRRLIRTTGCPYVLVKGGHRDDEPLDVLVTAMSHTDFSGRRIITRNDHGTGCTLSSAIAAQMALGAPGVAEAVKTAKYYVEAALAAGAGISIGKGHGPMNHFFNPRPAQIEEN